MFKKNASVQHCLHEKNIWSPISWNKRRKKKVWLLAQVECCVYIGINDCNYVEDGYWLIVAALSETFLKLKTDMEALAEHIFPLFFLYCNKIILQGNRCYDKKEMLR